MSAGVLPEELLTEVLSILPIKSILQFKCVCKSWKLLISDPFFVQKHLHLSQKRNSHLALILCRPMTGTPSSKHYYDRGCSVVPFSLNTLLLNPSITINILPHHRLRYKRCFRAIGSINGLLCLFNSRTIRYGRDDPYDPNHWHRWCYRKVMFDSCVRNTWFRLWNPATRKISPILGSINHPYSHPYYGGEDRSDYLRFAFGYDKLTHTYKVVAFCPDQVKIFNFRDNAWKTIQCFPTVPYYRVVKVGSIDQRVNEGVYLNGTVNWLAIPNSKYYWGPYGVERYDPPAIDQFVIISLDLGTETYNQLLPPQDLVDVPPILPTISVLRDFLCFSYHITTTHFAIWVMVEFGIQQSWTHFLNISYADLQIDYESRGHPSKYILHPLCLSEDGDTIILADSCEEQAFIYNWRDNSVEKTRITNPVLWMFSHNYIETLVSTGG